jgi:hypothetical protein
MISISMNFFFTNLHIESIFTISRKILYYWRKIGLFSASERTPGSHSRDTFEEKSYSEYPASGL